MKQTRRYFNVGQKWDLVERDGPFCIICGAMAEDADHAIRLSSALPNITEIWNGNLLCRRCHSEVTNPDTREKWEKALKIIQLALHRAYKKFPYNTYRLYYAYYKSKLERFNQLYGNQGNNK